MSEVSMNIHRVIKISARHQVGEGGAKWISIVFTDDNYGHIEVTAFAENEVYLASIAQAINSIEEPVE